MRIDHASKLRRKRELILLKGGKCKICGYDKIQYIRCFTFHHRNPDLKSFNLNTRSCASKKVMLEEMNKCDLLCMRCHMELHDEEFLEERELAYIRKRNPILSRICPSCNQSFKPAKNQAKYCSIICRNKSDKLNLDKEVLTRLYTEHKNFSKISRILGCSDGTIRKYCKEFGIIESSV